MSLAGGTQSRRRPLSSPPSLPGAAAAPTAGYSPPRGMRGAAGKPEHPRPQHSPPAPAEAASPPGFPPPPQPRSAPTPVAVRSAAQFVYLPGKSTGGGGREYRALGPPPPRLFHCPLGNVVSPRPMPKVYAGQRSAHSVLVRLCLKRFLRRPLGNVVLPGSPT
uniref:Basic salivary proline-rich protein 2-like n=1 Tax=Phascolarctos cinereus TaxID=38626 RepID=A0A6P5KGR5_PHACI|nr:basic salivary proline-rich protein 2-like [Phascolarctos cinereus]XP_020843657.1 basic salivary proline-rich protein 2-like [Phascolarctos cinereus]